jgi:hypothetical protein
MHESAHLSARLAFAHLLGWPARQRLVEVHTVHLVRPLTTTTADAMLGIVAQAESWSDLSPAGK